MDFCICKEVDSRAKEGKFDLPDELLRQYLNAKIKRIKQLQEVRKEVQKVVDKK